MTPSKPIYSFGLSLACIMCHQVSSFVQSNGLAGKAQIGSSIMAKPRLPLLFNSLTSDTADSTDSSDAKSGDVRSFHLLNEAIAFNVSAPAMLLSEISVMRESDPPKKSVETFLNNLLATGPDDALPIWTRSKLFARFSRRARMASLRRTLDMTTPPPSESSEGDSVEQKLQRRRRALLSLLRSLSAESESLDSKDAAIVSLEKKAIQASREGSEDLRNRLPDGLETPDYDIIANRVAGRKTVEIRRYKPYSVCAVSVNKPRPADSIKTDASLQMPEMSGASSFGALAGYLFGKNDKSTAMKMTTPVLSSPGQDAEDRQMEFVLPSEYWESGKVSGAPQPLAGSGVTLQEKVSEDRAVLMFGGYAAKKEVEKRKKELSAALSKDSGWKATEEVSTVAQYNDPFTVPWRRLNEVSVNVVPV